MYNTTMILLYLTAVFLGPVFSIWSLNLLFGLGIPLTIWTWLAAAWLQILVTTRTNGSKQ